jgi:membrane protease YdiL (CAAX protease family)
MENNIYLWLAAIAGVLFPAYAIISGYKTNFASVIKTKVYRSTSIELILLTFVCLSPFVWNDQPLQLLGLGFINNPWLIILLLTLAGVGMYLIGRIRFNQESARNFLDQMQTVSWLMPTNRQELRYLIFLSFVAGICEEVVYRGFLFWFLNGYMPWWIAVVVANIPFALAHLTTTGYKNTLNAYVLALIFSAAYLLTGSLWLSILLHILVDVYSGLNYFKAFHTAKGTEIDSISGDYQGQNT